jgi:diguanylate cyclase (GGDEF)-like protein
LHDVPSPLNESDRLAALQHYDLLAARRDDALDAICRVAASIFDCPIAAVSINDTNRQVIKGGVGFAADELIGNNGPCAYAMLGDGPLVVEDLSLDDRFTGHPLVHPPYSLRFYAGAPLLTPERVAIGALCVLDTRPRRPIGEQLANLSDLAQAVMALFNMRKAMSGTRNIALTDTLTGVANRAGLILELQALIERSRQRAAPFALIYLDIDNFKRVNDSLGHSAGDELLTRIGAALIASVRDADVPGRIGGDEFAILVADCDEAEAGRVANRVFDAIAAIAMPQHAVHVSVGSAYFPTPPADVNDALAVADRLMYAAKLAGKNRIVSGSTATLSVTA